LEYETLNLWKEINQIQNISLNYITCKVDYFNMLELKEIRKKLNNILIINNLNIKSLSYKNIEYDINYYGNTKILSKLFNLNQLNFSNHNKSCVIKLK
ncbi:hypothetical protein OA258_00930, partial [Pelagibacteraceae bacterium]|nr:hypothetical protein [Pelagibacteraceae bacterium]